MPPRRQQGRTFERQSGRVSLLMEAGQLWDGTRWREQPLRCGTRSRLAMIHISSEAVRDESPVMDVGRSIGEFLITPRHRAVEPGENSLPARGDKPGRKGIVSFMAGRRFSGCR